MICEKCLIEYFELYGSGRFCSKKCAKSFSTSKERIQINQKIRNKLKKPLIQKTCLQCFSIFLSKEKCKRKFCSRECSSKNINSRSEIKEKRRKSRLEQIEKGNIGYGIKCSIDDIRCDSALEYAFIKWYKNKHPNSVIKRYKGYLDTGDSKYQPDFIIDDKIIVEVKYTNHYIGEKLSKKWQTYINTQDRKKEALENSGYQYLWITEKTIGIKFYRECLKEVKN